jgi:hypothetical protein
MAKETRRMVKPGAPTSETVTRVAVSRAGAAPKSSAPLVNKPRRTITEQQIRERAYQIYLARNGGPGEPAADWSQAERELRAESER